ncbi:MAG: hypothetical protein AAGL11_02575 [Pseudomonadota bacterium]
MAAKRKRDLHETGDDKMKMAALKHVKAIKKDEPVQAVPSPAKALQDQLESHYQPLHQRMSVILVSLLVAFAFVGGWVGGAGGIGAI